MKSAGWGTDHVGQGKCRLHGGATPIKHGRYSKITRESIRKRIEKLANDPDPLDMLPDILLLRAYIEELIETKDVTADNALLNTMSGLVDKVGRMIERINDAKSQGSISVRAVAKIQEQMAVVVARNVSSEAMDKIADGWNAIVVDVR